jgi:hypothetical protein
MSARRVPIALAVVAILLCLSSALFAQNSKARIVRLSFIDGQVQIDRNAGQGWEKAILNMPIIQGTKLSAEQGSHVEVEFEDGSTVRLVGPAQIAFPELSLADGKKNSLVDAQSGLIYFDLPKVHDDSFRVSVAKHSFQVHKNAQFRVDASDPDQSVAVMKGELQLVGEPKEVAIKKNETIIFKFDRPEYALSHEVDKLGSDGWNKDREQDRELVARSDQYHNTNSFYGGNYNYGTYDLARYGNWYYGSGYGWLWRPYFYDASYAYDPFAWDPFGYGSWSFYPGAGWTFVSGYPWGWAPYRYGSWMFVPGFGWSWRPGSPTYGWQTVPPVVNAPPGYGIPRPPLKTSGTTVAVTAPTRTTVNGVVAGAGVPRPGRPVVPMAVVPTRPVVLPGALNADRHINTQAITPANAHMLNSRSGQIPPPTMHPASHSEQRSAPGVGPRMSPPPSPPPTRAPAPASGGGKPHS